MPVWFDFKYILPLALVAALVFFNLQARAQFVDPLQAKALVDKGARLVDVRTQAEYAGGHIQNAINIPLSQVKARLAAFGDKGSAIVLYCRSGHRSGKAKEILEAAGFTQVLNLGGIDRWPTP
ncbi:MAG: rhodanese-like domain-containing protein [Bradymonadia bacterium]